jgi:hypothetical protein
MNMNINLALHTAGTKVLVAQPTPDNFLKAINSNLLTSTWTGTDAMP